MRWWHRKARPQVARSESRVARSSFWPDVDPGLVILILAFILVMPFDTGSSLFSRLTVIFAPPKFATYEESLRDAAVKRPDQRVPLATIATSAASVDVVTFTRPTAPPADKRDFDIWVALPSELKAACAGAADPVHRLQEALGLPPIAAPDRVIRQISVAPDGLFRPCFSGDDLSAGQCDFNLPQRPDPADQTAVGKAYDRLRFVTEQMVSSYRTGFAQPGRKPTDYPFDGFPFTGMGRTYDWGATPTHVGVTEFVVRRDAPITIGTSLTPAEFCADAK